MRIFKFKIKWFSKNAATAIYSDANYNPAIQQLPINGDAEFYKLITF